MMNRQWYLGVILSMAILAAGCAENSDPEPMNQAEEVESVPVRLQADDISTDKNLWILKKDNDTAWRIWDKCGNNLGHLLATGGDRITWNAYQSDMTFTFSRADVAEFFQDSQQFTAEREDVMLSASEDSVNVQVAEGDSLNVTISGDAPRERMTYSVRVAADETLVEGSSPPVIIIY